MASNWAEVTRTAEYQSAVEMQLAETPGKFVPFADITQKKGARIQVIDTFGSLVMRPIRGRNAQTEHTDPNWTRRWMNKPVRSGVAVPVDLDDELATAVDLKGPLPKVIANAARQYHDDQFLKGIYGPALDGEEGELTTPFKQANVLPADTGETPGVATGLTLAKLIALRVLMKKRFVNTEQQRPKIVITAEDFGDLLSIDKLQNGDYVNKKLLENGEVTDFLGFDFVPAEIDNPAAYPEASQYAVNALGQRRLPVFMPNQVAMNMWLEFRGYDDVLPDMNHSEQFAGYSCAKATRKNDDNFYILEVA